MPEHFENPVFWEQIGVLKLRAATVVQYEEVLNMRVIHMVNAIYRGVLVHGTFELMDKTSDNVLIINEKGPLVKVVIDWKMRRPKSSCRKFSLRIAEYVIEQSYNGKVARRILD